MECHVQDTAQMIADSGVEANCAVVVARFVASPAFCIPTSIAIVLFLDVFIPTSFPAPYPKQISKSIVKQYCNEDDNAGLEEFMIPVKIQLHRLRRQVQERQPQASSAGSHGTFSSYHTDNSIKIQHPTGRITVSMIDTNIGSPLIVICVPLARNDTISGVMTGETSVETVVIPTENATSPPHR